MLCCRGGTGWGWRPSSYGSRGGPTSFGAFRRAAGASSFRLSEQPATVAATTTIGAGMSRLASTYPVGSVLELGGRFVLQKYRRCGG